MSSSLDSRSALQEQAKARKEKKRAASKGSLLCGGRMVIEKAVRESQVILKNLANAAYLQLPLTHYPIAEHGVLPRGSQGAKEQVQMQLLPGERCICAREIFTAMRLVSDVRSCEESVSIYYCQM